MAKISALYIIRQDERSGFVAKVAPIRGRKLVHCSEAHRTWSKLKLLKLLKLFNFAHIIQRTLNLYRMNQKLFPKMSRYGLLLLACAVLSGVGYFRTGTSGLLQPAAVKTPVVNVSDQTTVAPVQPAIETPYEQAKRGETPVARPTEAQLKEVEQVAGKNWLSQALKGIEESEYHIRWNAEKNAPSSVNRRQNLRFYYAPNGFEMTPRTAQGSWTAGLKVQSVAGLKPSLNASVETKANTLLAHHNGFSVEFVNNEQGMRQNFILPSRPAGAGNEIEVRLTPTGTLTASQSGFNEIAFINAEGQAQAYYKDLKVWDATGRTLESSMNLTGGEVVLAVNVADAQFPVTIDPISCTPNWMNNQGGLFNQVDMQFGYSVAVAGQQTGRLNHRSFGTATPAAPDFADIIVGAPNYDNASLSGIDHGAVFVYFGQAAGPSMNPDWQMLGTQSLSLFGYSVACAGNVYNHTAAEVPPAAGSFNGIADLIVGAPRWSLSGPNSNEGRIFMWYGTPTGLSTTPLASGADWATSNIGRTPRPGAQLGFSVAGAGEVYAGVLPNAVQPATGTSQFAGEIVAGAPFFTGTAAQHGTAAQFGGAAVVFFGNRSVGVWPTTGAGEGPLGPNVNGEVFVAVTDHGAGTTFPFFGWSVHRSGDLSADGVAAGDNLNEILVGSPGYETNAAETDEGAAYLIFSQTGASKAITVGTGNVVAPTFVATSAIIPGSRLEIVKGPAPVGPHYQVIEGQQAGAQLGYSVAGDFQINQNDNSQVTRDLVVGAPLAERMMSLSEEGLALVFTGLAPAPAVTPTWYLSHNDATDAVNQNVLTRVNATAIWGNQQGARFGWSVAGVGDMDGNRQTAVPVGPLAGPINTPPFNNRSNGYGEVIIGAPFGEGPVSPQLDEGFARIYYGSATGVNQNDFCVLEGNRQNMQFGYSVTGTPGVSATGGSTATAGINSSSLQNDLPVGSLAGRVQLADVVIGAPGYDNTENSISDRNQGRAYAYYGRIRPTVVFDPLTAPFCPGSAPIVRANVFDMAPGQAFTLTYLEGSQTRTANYVFTPIAGSNPSRMQITLPTNPQGVTTVYTLSQIQLGECCRHVIGGAYTATASIPSLTNFRADDVTLCTGQTPRLLFNIPAGSGVAINDQIRVVYSAAPAVPIGSPFVRQPDFNFTAPSNPAINDIQITNTTPITQSTIYRIDSIINVTRNCGVAVIGQQVTVNVTTIPTVTITIDPFCPGTVPVIRGTITGLANDNIRWRITGRVNDPISGAPWSISGRGNFPNPTQFAEQPYGTDPVGGPAWGIEAENGTAGSPVLRTVINPTLGQYTPAQLNANPFRVGNLIGSEPTDPTFLDNVLVPQSGNLTLYIDDITIINTPQLPNTPFYTQTLTRKAGGFVVNTPAFDPATGLGNPPTVHPDNCLFNQPFATIPRMVTGLAMNQLPDAQFDPSPIFFCSGTTPTIRVRVTNVAVGQRWLLAWKEQSPTAFVTPPVQGPGADPTLLLYEGVGPGLFNLVDDNTGNLTTGGLPGVISPGVGPTVRFFDTNYRIGWITAGGCTTTYGGISQNITNAVAVGQTTPTVQFEPVAPFCAGQRPTIRFNVTNVPAGESYTFSGYYNRYFKSGPNSVTLIETRAFNTVTFTGNTPTGSPFNFNRIIIGADTLELPVLAQNDSIEFFFTRYRNVNAPLCEKDLVSVSTGVSPSQGVTISINPIPNFCPNSNPSVTVSVPAGNWTITYIESTPFGSQPRSVGINAPVSGAYALQTSVLNTNATYTLISAVQNPVPPNACPVQLGASRTAFVSQNALPNAQFIQPAFFCSGSVPQIRVDVTNVPFVSGPINQMMPPVGAWRIGWREGQPNAAIQFTPYQAGGATTNFLLPVTNPQSQNTSYYIAVIEVFGQCSRTYTNNMITAFSRPTPSVQFINAPQSVCPGARPFISVEITGIPVGNPYELVWEEGVGGPLRTQTGLSSGSSFVLPLNVQNNVNSPTAYKIISLVDRSTNCAATLNPSLTTLNLQIDNSASPTAIFTATNYNYCSTTLPMLAVNVGNIVDPSHSWTITYREEPNGPAQTVSGVGPVNNFMFSPSIAPSAAVVTYRILSIQNNVTGCQSNIANAATATRTLNAGVVSLDPVTTTCTNSAPNFTVRIPGVTATQSWVLNWNENGNIRSTFGLGPVFTLPINDPTLYSTPGTRTVQLLSINISTQLNNPQCNPSVDMTVRTFQVVSGAPAASFSTMNVTSVCSGTIPVVNVNISPAAAYTLRYRINDNPVPMMISGFGSMANIGGSTPITAQTKYSLVDITSGGCTQDLGETAFVINVNANPSVVFAAANYDYCTGGRPTLSLNVSNITNINDSWTVTYRQTPGGASQTVSGTGNVNNFTFTVGLAPSSSPATYEIISIRNNSTTCIGTSTSTTVATAGASAGTVTLNPIANICAGNLPAVSVNVPGVSATQTWTLNWSENGDPRTSVGVGPAFNLPTTAALYNTPGTRTISLVSITIPSSTCQPELGSPVSFQVLNSPNASFAPGMPVTLCAGSTPMVNVNITPAGTGLLNFRVNGGPVQQVNYSGSSVNIGGSVPVTSNTTWELVSISDGTCTRPLSAVYTLNVTPGINPTIVSITQPTGCLGNGSITVRGATNVSGLSYSIRNNDTGVQTPFAVSSTDQFVFNNLNPGSYTFFVRDVTGCEASVGPVNLTASGPLVPTLLSVTPINDNTAQVSFTSVSGGSPYTVRYRSLPNGPFLTQVVNNSSTGTITTTIGGLQAGLTYEFSVASACNPTNFSNILTFSTQSACLVNPLLAVPTGVVVNTQIIGSIAKVATVGWNKVAGATGYVVRWRVAGGNPNYSNIVRCDAQIPDDSNNPSRKLFTIPGSFLVGVTYEVQVAAQCQQCGVAPNVAGTSNFTATVTFRLEDETAAASRLSVYPNPNDGEFTVNFTAAEATEATVTIFDIAGRQVLNRTFTAQPGENSLPISLEGVAAGVYTLRFVQNGVASLTKVVLN
jgi:uncharacterized protein (DUF736 family)